jgi:hypothetical protein
MEYSSSETNSDSAVSPQSYTRAHFLNYYKLNGSETWYAGIWDLCASTGLILQEVPPNSKAPDDGRIGRNIRVECTDEF